MAFNYKLALILCLTFSINLTYLLGDAVNIDYSFLNKSYYSSVLGSNSFLLRINTEKESSCRYSSFKGALYKDISGNFDPGLGREHEKSFSDLEDGGIYKYYIKCAIDPENLTTEPAELEAVFKIDSLVDASILLSEKAPLKEGKVALTLTTSKPTSQKPSLSYSFDGNVYNKLFLSGSGDAWKGFLIIPGNLGETILSFKFKSVDLEGRVSESIGEGESFIIDTTKPDTIAEIIATGYEGQIRIYWYFEGEANKFNIYRSEFGGIGYTDFYSFAQKSPFYDNSVERGKTYYYRVTAVDSAGNEAALSKEVYATALISNVSVSSSLAPSLIGFVDSFISEVDSVLSEAETAKNAVSAQEKMAIFSELGLDKEIQNRISELNSLKKDAEQFKLQSLTKEELTKKLDSFRLKLNIIRQKMPENLVILEESSDKEEMSEETLDKAILEIEPEIPEKQKEESIKESLKIIKASNLDITNYYYSLEILYLDGTKKQISAVKRVISAILERDDNSFFVEIIPKEVIESASELTLKNSDYRVVKEDPVLSFGTDTKQILYFFDGKSDMANLKQSTLSYVRFANETSVGPSSITGNFFVEIGQRKYTGIFIGIFLIAILFVYFVFLRKKAISDNCLRVLSETDRASELAKKKDIKGAGDVYMSIKELYKNLNNDEKKTIHKRVEKLHIFIVLSDFENKLERFLAAREKSSLEELKKSYLALPDESRRKIEKRFQNALEVKI
jgi:hypothetical protein